LPGWAGDRRFPALRGNELKTAISFILLLESE
jgi:hypothetical protein